MAAAAIKIRPGWYDEYEGEARGHRLVIVGDEERASELRERLLRVDPGVCRRVHGTGFTFERPPAGASSETWARDLVGDALGPEAADLVDFAASKIERVEEDAPQEDQTRS